MALVAEMNTTEPSSEQAPDKANAPAHQLVYHRLREQILFGELAPGQAVTIQGLSDGLNAGVTPVREAIRRLTAEGALEFMGNRRVSVPMLSLSNIDEMIIARGALEPELARRAAKIATKADIQKLTELDDVLDIAIESGDLAAYLETNYRFHAMIYDIANAPLLTQIVDGMWLRFGPSLRVVCGRLGTQNLPDKHKELLTAMRLGDTEAAADALLGDVMQGLDQVRAVLETSDLSS